MKVYITGSALTSAVEFQNEDPEYVTLDELATPSFGKILTSLRQFDINDLKSELISEFKEINCEDEYLPDEFVWVESQWTDNSRGRQKDFALHLGAEVIGLVSILEVEAQ